MSSILNHIVISFHIVASIPLPRLSTQISVPRRDIIARILLQSVGLCLRALSIELLAKLALGTTLRCFGSFLVSRAWSARSPVILIAFRIARRVEDGLPEAFTSRQSQPSSWAHATVACSYRNPVRIGMYAPRRLLRLLLWEMSQ